MTAVKTALTDLADKNNIEKNVAFIVWELSREYILPNSVEWLYSNTLKIRTRTAYLIRQLS